MRVQLFVLVACYAAVAAEGFSETRPFVARPDPLGLMMRDGGDGMHRMPMEKRRAELLQIYHKV